MRTLQPDWDDEAPCDVFPELFFRPDLDVGREPLHIQRDREKEAVNLCLTGDSGRRCPRFAWCAANADPDDEVSVIAATTPKERKDARREAAKARKAAA